MIALRTLLEYCYVLWKQPGCFPMMMRSERSAHASSPCGCCCCGGGDGGGGGACACEICVPCVSFSSLSAAPSSQPFLLVS